MENLKEIKTLIDHTVEALSTYTPASRTRIARYKNVLSIRIVGDFRDDSPERFEVTQKYMQHCIDQLPANIHAEAIVDSFSCSHCAVSTYSATLVIVVD